MTNLTPKSIVIFVKNLTSGGAEKQSVILAHVLARKHHVHYVIFNGNKVHGKYLAYLDSNPDICVHILNGRFFRRIIHFYYILRTESIDFIFSYLTMANLIAAFMGNLTKIKVYSSLRNAHLPWPKMFADCLVCNVLADGTISNSFSGKQYFSTKGFNKKKIIVIPNCFENISPYTPKNSQNTVRIITVGRFVAQKDYLTAIKAIAEVRKRSSNFVFVIVGYGELEEKIRIWVKEHGIADCTEIHINPDNISLLEDAADIYLSTSLFEGVSNSIMEGMNANLPIVCTDVGDNSHLVENGLNGYLCQVKDSHAIAEALFSLVCDIGKRDDFGRKSKQILSEKYNVESFYKKYSALLNEISYESEYTR
mgnify:CR=1 FL=1